MFKIKKRNFKIQGSKFHIYLKIILAYLIPYSFYRKQLDSILDITNDPEKDYLLARLNYYNKVSSNFCVSESAPSVNNLKVTKQAMYFYDMLRLLKYFPENRRFDVLFGDITFVPDIPTLVKSRPIGDNENSVLQKLNSIRHFYFVKDHLPYRKKIDKIVWRGGIKASTLRKVVVEKYFNNEFCDVGFYPYKEFPEYGKDFMSIKKQLEYKFILSIEGNDVATNLKWIAASNSLCFMTRPRFETWFMEGRLLPGVHYVELNDDFSDLEEKITFYLDHPDQAELIIKNANDYVGQFLNPKRELKIALLVLDKYFACSGQSASN